MPHCNRVHQLMINEWKHIQTYIHVEKRTKSGTRIFMFGYQIRNSIWTLLSERIYFFLFVISVTVFVCTILKKFFVSDPAVSKLNQSHKDVLLTVFFFTIISSCLHVTQLDQFRFGNRSALNRSHDNGNLALKTCILKHREIHSIGTSPSPLARQWLWTVAVLQPLLYYNQNSDWSLLSQ